MIAKIVKGTSFSGVVKYILDPEKQTNLLAADGVRLKNLDSIAQSFEAQRELNSRVSKPVGHISLDFSAQDRDKLSNGSHRTRLYGPDGNSQHAVHHWSTP